MIYVICERCGKTIYKYNTCNYCKKKVCFNCVKSSRRVSKVWRLVICKSCWSKMPARKLFKGTTKE
ncbi:MAG: hypothetical protein M1569_02650 [Candidatus Marsarchaeota archaeon]|nr:hypothetical protein [Candidatus Marsarchaeota archaeon]